MVQQLQNLEELDDAFDKAGQKVVAICFHNGCPTAEAAWDKIQPQYQGICFYKVDTLKA